MEPINCKECGKETQRQGVAQKFCKPCSDLRRKNHNKTPERRAKIRFRMRELRQRPEFREREKKYNQRNEVKARNNEAAREIRKTEKRKLWHRTYMKAYQNRPKEKARRKVYNTLYRFVKSTPLKPSDLSTEVKDLVLAMSELNKSIPKLKKEETNA